MLRNGARAERFDNNLGERVPELVESKPKAAALEGGGEEQPPLPLGVSAKGVAVAGQLLPILRGNSVAAAVHREEQRSDPQDREEVQEAGDQRDPREARKRPAVDLGAVSGLEAGSEPVEEDEGPN